MDGIPEGSRAYRCALSPPNAGTKRRTPLYRALCGRVVLFVLFGLRGQIRDVLSNISKYVSSSLPDIPGCSSSSFPFNFIVLPGMTFSSFPARQGIPTRIDARSGRA